MKKRELLAHYILCRENGKTWNIGEAIDTLMDTLLVNKKTAFSIIRRLKRMGLLVKDGEMVYKCVGFEEYIRALYENYVYKKKRRLKH